MIELPINFLHVIKTGGSTIAQHLDKHLDGFHSQDLKRAKVPGSVLMFNQGHRIALPGSHANGSFFTIWRNPAAWYLSGYNHARARGYGGHFDEWYQSGTRDAVNLVGGYPNKMTKWCATYWRLRAPVLEAVLEVLEQCDFLSLTEYLDEDLPYLFRFLGIPEKAERRRVSGEWDPEDRVEIPKTYDGISPEMQRVFRKDNPIDYLIYDYVKQKRREKGLWLLSSQ